MNNKPSLKRTAHFTGILYFILAVIGAINLEYIPSQVTVSGDAEATCRNILSHESLYRFGLALSMMNNFLYILLALMFYRLFKNVDRSWAILLVILVLVQVPISFIFDTLDITALMILKGDILKGLDISKAQEYATLLRRINSNGTQMSQIFWGLWLVPMGVLIYRSKFIARFVGVLVLITAVAYTFNCFVFILIPQYQELIGKFVFPLFIGELAIVFWLLLKGVKKEYAKVL